MYRLKFQSFTPLICALICAGWIEPAMTDANASETAATQVKGVSAPALMLSRNWPLGDNPASYWISEKFDGVRAFWDGKTLRFRSGAPIAAPAWWTAVLPNTALDGELWLGRGRFDELSGMVRHLQPDDAQWQQVQYLLFDLPGSAGRFSERIPRLNAVVQQINQPWVKVVHQQRVSSAEALQVLLRAMVKAGGEGLVLHRADALWAPGRSDALFKLKPAPDDDARVVAQLPGKGKYAGRMGALLLEMSDGRRFALGSGFTDAQRDKPPPVGALVTYRYRSQTANGLPRFASFLRVRELE